MRSDNNFMKNLTKKELAIIMQMLKLTYKSDYFSSMEGEYGIGFPKLLIESGIKNSEQANKVADKAYDKINEQYLKKTKYARRKKGA